MRYAFLLAYIATIPAANWMIGNVGSCIPNGPCLVDVGFGLSAPSGVLMVGFALVLRDIIHDAFGAKVSIAAIVAGAIASAFFASPVLAVASALAFLLSELADLVVYAPLRERRYYVAIAASGIAGAIVDSAVFLYMAFGSIDFIAGQVLGKMWMTALAMLAIWAVKMAERGRISV